VVDRKKDMILCGGENVYCSEVEAVIISHPAVAQVAAFGVPNVVLGELVAAAVVLKTPAQLAAAGASSSDILAAAAPAEIQRQLTDWCRTRLAHYKVPSQVHVVEAMPVTGSGKILKTALRERFAAAPARPALASSAASASLPAPQPHQRRMQTAVPVGRTFSVQELAARVAAALHAGAPAAAAAVMDVASSAASSLVLIDSASYVLLLQDVSTAQQQVQVALSKGARHLLLLSTSDLSAQTLSALGRSLDAHRAQAVLLLVDAAICADRHLLAFSIFDAAQGMPLPSAVLLTGGSPPLQLAVPGFSTAELAAAAAAALGSVIVTLGSGLSAGLVNSSTYVMPVTSANAANVLQQQLQDAVKLGARHLVLVAGAEPSASVLKSVESVLQAAGGMVTLALLDAAAARSSNALAYALLDASAGMPPVDAVLLPGTAATSLATAPGTGPAQPLSAAAAAAAATAAASSAAAAGEASMAEVIKAALSDLLGTDAASSISLDDPLMSSGVNSTTAVALTTQLETSLSTSLPPTLVFDYVTIRDMSAYLASIVSAEQTVSSAPAAPTGAATAGVLGAPVLSAHYRATGAFSTPVAAAAGPSAAAVALVTECVQELIGGDAVLDPSAPLMSVGLNSTMAVGLASSLEAAVGNPVPPTLVSTPDHFAAAA
jgi:acyl carrier protein